MTDNHETDALHGELPENDHPLSPPVDDFADASSTTEEAATISQESAAEDDMSASHAERGSRSKVPLLLGLLGLFVVGGGYAFWQFSRSTEPVTVSESETAKPLASMQEPSPTSDTQAATAASPTANSMPSNSMPAPSQTPSLPSPMPPTDTANLYKQTADTTQLQAVQPPAAIPTPPLPSGPATPVAAVPANPTPLPSATNSMMPPTSLPPVTSSNQGQLQSRVDALSARLDSVQKALDQANRELSQVSAAETATASRPGANTDVEQRLTKVEHNLSQLEAKPSVMAKSETTASLSPSSHHVKTVQKAKPKKIVTAAHHKAPKTPVVQQAWILRAATPSEAWISADASSSDLKHVAVGDSVDGIGQVKSISQTGQGWEIVGSDATIR